MRRLHCSTMKLDQPWCTLHYQIDNQLLILCKQEVTTPKRHTDIIRDKTCTWATCVYRVSCVSVRVRVCVREVCAEEWVRARKARACVYVSTDVYVRVSDSMASNTNNNYPIN